MQFLFPLFLISGLALAIPIIIHLFNFKKYKVVAFSDTKRLQEIKISSQKKRTVKNWWLLMSRLLLLSALILAFAQPFLQNISGNNKSITLLYIDNSASMGDRNEQQKSLLDQAKEQATSLINTASEEAQFIILNNHQTFASRPVNKTEAQTQILNTKLSAKTVNLNQINNSAIAAIEDNNANSAHLHLFTDAQKSSLVAKGMEEKSKDVHFLFHTIKHESEANVYIDTAYFSQPVIDSRASNPLIVKLKSTLEQNQTETQVKVLIDGQVRASKGVQLNNDKNATDTISLMVNTPGWHQIEVIVKDAPIQFDDTFRITAKTNAQLSILHIGTGVSNPHLGAAFSANNGFQFQHQAPLSTNTSDWHKYNLIIIPADQLEQGSLGEKVKMGLAQGLSFFIIPSGISNVSTLNASLQSLGPISLGTLDTSATEVTNIQREHPLLQDVIATLPEQAALPKVLKHYPIQAGINAQWQTVMSLKNGQPFLGQAKIGPGRVFLLATGLEAQWSNFAWSNLFMPILYKMAASSGAQAIYAINANSANPIFIPNQGVGQSVYEVKKGTTSQIPAQKSFGNGTQIFLGQSVQEPGFYSIRQKGIRDSVLVAVNPDTKESDLEAINEKEVIALLQPSKVSWNTSNNVSNALTFAANRGLWPWLMGIAALALLLECYFLIFKRK